MVNEQNIAQYLHNFGIRLSELMARISSLACHKAKPEDRAFHSHHQAIFRCDPGQFACRFPFWLAGDGWTTAKF